jgi:hypothetical protein
MPMFLCTSALQFLPFVYGDDSAAHEIIVGWKQNAIPKRLR